MPTYQYKCPSCAFEFDSLKGFDEIDTPEVCPQCSRSNIEGTCRIIRARQFFGEKPDDAFYSIPLGKIVKSKRAQAAEAKSRGWEELGTTDIDKHIDRVDRHRQEKLDSRWDEYLKG